MGMDVGALTTYFYGFRDRELLNDIFEETCGARLTMNYNVPGGLMLDIHPNFVKRVKKFVAHFKTKIPEYDRLLTNNVIFQKRTKGVGILSKEDAISFGTSGPVARASGYSRRSARQSCCDGDFRQMLSQSRVGMGVPRERTPRWR